MFRELLECLNTSAKIGKYLHNLKFAGRGRKQSFENNHALPFKKIPNLLFSHNFFNLFIVMMHS